MIIITVATAPRETEISKSYSFKILLLYSSYISKTKFVKRMKKFWRKYLIGNAKYMDHQMIYPNYELNFLHFGEHHSHSKVNKVYTNARNVKIPNPYMNFIHVETHIF